MTGAPERPLKLSVVAYHCPNPEGTAVGRGLHALCEGLIVEGHQVEVWSWGPDALVPETLPPWCRHEPLPPEPALLTRARALVRPRSDIVRARWRPPADAIALADDTTSFAAVASSERSVLNFYDLASLEAGALGRRSPRDVQSRRADRSAARRAKLVTTSSERVAKALGLGAVVVPFAYAMPPEPVAPVPEPVAMLLAGWTWPPNRAALATLLAVWPDVRRTVPEARLLLAGRDLPATSLPEGVEAIGRVERAVEAYAQASVVAFPCPESSGVKVKVLEALAYGVPVVTTPAGAEGLAFPTEEGTVLASVEGFGEALARLLADPDRRRELGASGRRAVSAAHAPVPAARARVAALRAAFG